MGGSARERKKLNMEWREREKKTATKSYTSRMRHMSEIYSLTLNLLGGLFFSIILSLSLFLFLFRWEPVSFEWWIWQLISQCVSHIVPYSTHMKRERKSGKIYAHSRTRSDENTYFDQLSGGEMLSENSKQRRNPTALTNHNISVAVCVCSRLCMCDVRALWIRRVSIRLDWPLTTDDYLNNNKKWKYVCDFFECLCVAWIYISINTHI